MCSAASTQAARACLPPLGSFWRYELILLPTGVPTVWLNLLAFMARSGRRLHSFKVAVIGGAAAARSLIEALETT